MQHKLEILLVILKITSNGKRTEKENLQGPDWVDSAIVKEASYSNLG